MTASCVMTTIPTSSDQQGASHALPLTTQDVHGVPRQVRVIVGTGTH